MMAAPKVLLADDDAALLSVVALHLRNEEYEVVCTEDGAEALEMARRERPDVLVISVNLPAGDRQTIHERLADYPDLLTIPVVYLVGEPRRGWRGEPPKLPAQSVVKKPVATSELLPKVEAALRRAGRRVNRPDDRVAAA